jgi:hypothetical protein
LKNIPFYIRVLSILIVAGYGVFTWWMIRQAGQSEVNWSRLVYLYQGVEAIVFAAAGVIFGTSIHRAQLDDARRSEREARQHASNEQSAGEVGRGLDAALRADPSRLVGSDAPPARSDRIRSDGRPGAQRNPDEEDAVVAYLLRLSGELKAGASVGDTVPVIGSAEERP